MARIRKGNYERIGSVIFFGRGLKSQIRVRLSSPAVTKWLLLWGAHATAETAAVWPGKKIVRWGGGKGRRNAKEEIFLFFFFQWLDFLTLQNTACSTWMTSVNHNRLWCFHANRCQVITILQSKNWKHFSLGGGWFFFFSPTCSSKCATTAGHAQSQIKS